ncbi:unnamed protein product [Discosporangium mesarthrocarpum]
MKLSLSKLQSDGSGFITTPTGVSIFDGKLHLKSTGYVLAGHASRHFPVPVNPVGAVATLNPGHNPGTMIDINLFHVSLAMPMRMLYERLLSGLLKLELKSLWLVSFILVRDVLLGKACGDQSPSEPTTEEGSSLHGLGIFAAKDLTKADFLPLCMMGDFAVLIGKRDARERSTSICSVWWQRLQKDFAVVQGRGRGCCVVPYA